MTLRPLDWSFAMMSPLSKRHPRDVPVDEQLLDLEDELARRQRNYPRLIAKGRLTQVEADRHNMLLGAIINDVRPIDDELPDKAYRRCLEAKRERRAELPFTWEDRVRELRRELALRRNIYPGQLAEHRISEEEARRRCERMDAVHWSFWYDLFGFDDDDRSAVPVEKIRAAIRRHWARAAQWELAAYAAGEPAGAHLAHDPNLIAEAEATIARAIATGAMPPITEAA